MANSKNHHPPIIYHLEYLEETHFRHFQLVEDHHLQEDPVEFNNFWMLIKIKHHWAISYLPSIKAINDINW